ncbi:MAG: thiol-disulfide oxidoreductase DCC family protein [Planctomycetota bacterium]
MNAVPQPAAAAPAPRPEPPGAVVLFDGDCTLCNGAVQFVLRRDPRGRFRFAALQSGAARALLAGRVAGDPLPDSMVLVQGDAIHLRSGAALRIARGLGLPWSLAAVFLLVPRPLRDLVYDFVARRRHRWFGRPASCLVPTPELRARFLDAGERSGG